MKTRDRILETALLLFNEEGEADQSAVDIANVLDMSPGNLYYHFKGKDAIIRALFDDFECEMTVILNGSRGRITSIEDNWVYTYILLEEIYDFRFFYRNLGVLLERYPDLARRFRSLLSTQRQTIAEILSNLQLRGLIAADPLLIGMLIDQILKIMTFWLSFDQIEGGDMPAAHLIHKTVYQIMVLVVPYMGEQGLHTLRTMTDHYERSVGRLGF
ncbi:MAG: TetR/AcrR family transcriptional regulator [Pseudomonadota bacterium]